MKQHTVYEQLTAWQTQDSSLFANEDLSQYAQLSAKAHQEAQQYSWPIQVLAAIGAFFSASMFIGFLAIGNLFGSESACLMLGTLLLGGSVWYSRNNQREARIFLDPLVLMLGWLGQTLLAVGLERVWSGSDNAVIAMFGVLEIVILVFSHSKIQRFISFALAQACAIFLCYNMSFAGSVHLFIAANVLFISYLHSNEAHILAKFRWAASYFEPLSWGSIGVLCVLLVSAVFPNTSVYFQHLLRWISAVAIALAWGNQAYFLRHYTRQMPVAVSIAAIFLCVILFFSYGIAVALLLLCIGFSVGNRILLAFAVLALLYFTSMFYYNLQTILLYKSLMMMALGALFLLGYWRIKSQKLN